MFNDIIFTTEGIHLKFVDNTGYFITTADIFILTGVFSIGLFVLAMYKQAKRLK